MKLLPLTQIAEEDPATTSIVFLVCCHNRRETTLTALRRLGEQQGVPDVRGGVLLVDDGSTDGTAEAVIGEFPDVKIVPGSGNLFWSRSMSLAQEQALALCKPDFLCWLNDDVELAPGALRLMVESSGQDGAQRPVAGAFTDPASGALTYSGYANGASSRPLDLHHVVPNGALQDLATFNGNFVLVPRLVYERVGAVDPAYTHGYGDVDYGYRSAKSGFVPRLVPQPLGTCARNLRPGTWRDPELAVRSRVRILFSPKGVDPRSNKTLHKRYAGRMWWFFFVTSYARPLLSIVTSRLTRTRQRSG